MRTVTGSLLSLRTVRAPCKGTASFALTALRASCTFYIVTVCLIRSNVNTEILNAIAACPLRDVCRHQL